MQQRERAKALLTGPALRPLQYITALVPDDEHALFWARVGFRRQPVANIAELPALHATLEQSRRQQGLVSGASVWYAELPAKAIADAQVRTALPTVFRPSWGRCSYG